MPKRTERNPELDTLFAQERRIIINSLTKIIGEGAEANQSGETLSLGRTTIRPTEFGAETISFRVSVRPDMVDHSGKTIYKEQDIAKWGDLFRQLGFQQGDARDYHSGTIPKDFFMPEKIAPFSPEAALKEVGQITVKVNREDLLQRLDITNIEMGTMKTEAIKHNNKMDRAQELGVSYVKYLEQRGQSTLSR